MNKRNFNINRGITLVAVVVSIVVLLVIAAVTIGAVKENKIVEHSQTAVEDFTEKQFEEQLEIIFLSYTTANQRKLSINNKMVANKILNIFDYQNINTTTGDLLDGAEETTDLYTMTAEDGMVNVKDNSNSETILAVTYDKENKPKFTVEYKGTTYEYNNYKLAKVDYYVNGNPDDWVYNELEDGSIEIVGYIGNGELDLKNPGVYNLTIPNRLNGRTVSVVEIGKAGVTTANYKNLEKINGKLIFSYGLNHPVIRGNYNKNVQEIILKKNVINPQVQLGNNVRRIYISSGCEIGTITNQLALVDVEIEDSVTFLGNRNFLNASNLSEQSVTEILSKANNYTPEMFYLIPFPEDFEVNFPQGKDNPIGSNKLFLFKANSKIGKINIMDNTIVSTGLVGISRVFDTQTGVIIKNLNIGKNCNVEKLIYNNTVAPTVNNLSIGEGTIVNSYSFCQAEINEINISDNCIVEARGFHTIKNIERITIGKNVELKQYAFASCTFADGAVVEMYLTDEQKADNSKIPTLWFESTGAFTKTIGADKVIWTKN